MALQSSGAISLANIASEFGGSTPHSLSEYYGVASGVPGSGTISFSNFYGTSSVITVTRSSNGTNIILSSEFGSNWTANIAKVYNINNGVTLGGSGQEALQVSAGMGGSLTINNAGEIQGYHGTGGSGGSGCSTPGCQAGNGSAGGNGGIAIYVHSGANPTINNTGAIRGGGGGGGGGGGSGQAPFIFSMIPAFNGTAGGTGQGYNQSNTNASTAGNYYSYGGGGTGGNGGTWGNNGGAGGDGHNLQTSGTWGAAGIPGDGAAGGSAGAAITGSSRSLNNSGTINGST